jgi:hypothetical protein
MEMFDRYLLLANKSENWSESDIIVWVNTFLFMAAKYFRVLTVDLGLNEFTVGIIPDEFYIFQQRAVDFEENVVRNIFKYNVYRPTIYEEADDFLSENAIAHFIKLLTGTEIPSGIKLKSLWHNQSDIIAVKNQRCSPVATSSTPVVSMINY